MLTSLNCFDEKFLSLSQYKQEKNFKKCINSFTLDDVRDAINRAKKIEAMNKRNGKKITKLSGYSYYRDNPSMSIHEVVERILEECGLLNK